jgi:hypothetical protein
MKDNWRPFENQQYGDPYNGEMRIVGRVTEDGDKLIIPYSAIDGERRRTFDRGYTINNQINFTGGDDNGTYYMSLENNKIAGIVPGDQSKRTGVRIAATKQSKKIKVGFNASYVQGDYDRTTSDFYFDVLNVAAHIPISTLRDWRNNKFASPNGFYDDYYNNPYFNKDIQRQNYQDANLSGNLEMGYQLLPWLNLYNRIGIVNNSRTRKNYVAQFIYSDWAKNEAYVPAPWDYANDYDGIGRATDIQGSVFDAITNENVINNDAQIQLAKDFGNFSNKMTLGFNVYQRKTKATSVGSGSVVVPDIYNVSNRRGELTGGESNTTERKYGYYADLTTGWKDMLFVHGSFRYDATSRFFKSTRSSSLYSFPYYGVDVSFIVTEALPNFRNDVLNYAKLRAGYNRNGNDNIPLYGLDLSYSNGGGFPYGNTVGLTVGDLQPNADLKPEFVTSYEVGGEFQFWKSRIDFNASVYTQKSNNQVLDVKIPASTGFSFTRINVGEVKNWGYEADLRVQVIKKDKFNWEISGRYSRNENKVEKLYPGVKDFFVSGYTYAGTYVVEGESFPLLRGQAYSRDPATGRVLVSKTTGYPLRESKNALQNFGTTIPKHIAGAGTRIRYADLTLAANFEYRGGNVIFNQLGRDMTFTGSGAWTEDRTPHIFPNSAYDDGTGKFVPNNDVQVRESEYALWVDNYRFISENFITPGWFIKLRDINLSYNLPTSLLNKTKFITGASVAIYGRNLFTVVDKTNYYTDPEFSFTTGNGVGINNTGQTPPVRQYGINLNLTF